MGLKGKFLRREGTQVIFGSRNKPEWKPMDIGGQVDMGALEPGAYYEIDVDNNKVLSARRLEPRPGQSSGGIRHIDQGPSSNTPGAWRPDTSGAPETVRRESLMASATGVVKSALEANLDPELAIALGLKWAGLWGEAPMVVRSPEAPRPQELPPAAEPARWTPPNLDDEPF